MSLGSLWYFYSVFSVFIFQQNTMKIPWEEKTLVEKRSWLPSASSLGFAPAPDWQVAGVWLSCCHSPIHHLPHSPPLLLCLFPPTPDEFSSVACDGPCVLLKTLLDIPMGLSLRGLKLKFIKECGARAEKSSLVGMLPIFLHFLLILWFNSVVLRYALHTTF